MMDPNDPRLYYTVPDNRSVVYVDFEEAQESNIPTSRLVIELFDEKVPESAQLFRQWVQNGEFGDMDRLTVVKDMAISFDRDNQSFPDEIMDRVPHAECNVLKHDSPFHVSMMHYEEGAFSKQYPSLTVTAGSVGDWNGQKVVVGRIITSRRVFQNINHSFQEEDNGAGMAIKVTGSGVVTDHRIKVGQPDEYGDFYDLAMSSDVLIDRDNFESVYNAAGYVKQIATDLYKRGELVPALQKYTRAVLFLNDYFPDDLTSEQIHRLVGLKNSTNLNIALLSNRSGSYQNTVDACNQVLEIDETTSADRIKALYRRAVALLNLNNEVDAEADLKLVLEVLPSDAAALQLMDKVNLAKRQRQQQVRSAMRRAFA